MVFFVNIPYLFSFKKNSFFFVVFKLLSKEKDFLTKKKQRIVFRYKKHKKYEALLFNCLVTGFNSSGLPTARLFTLIGNFGMLLEFSKGKE